MKDYSEPMADDDVHDVILNDIEATKRLLQAIFRDPDDGMTEVEIREDDALYNCEDLDCAACEWAARNPAPSFNPEFKK